MSYETINDMFLDNRLNPKQKRNALRLYEDAFFEVYQIKKAIDNKIHCYKEANKIAIDVLDCYVVKVKDD